MTPHLSPRAPLAATFVGAALLIAAPALAAKIFTFDPPNSDDTYAAAINRNGVIAGFYDVLDGDRHGFLRAVDGTITTFDPPNSYRTWAVGINDAGVVAGHFDVQGGGGTHKPYSDLQHGYVRTPDGMITSFDPPGCDYTTVAGINRKGDVAGYSEDTNNPSMYHGFLLAADGTMTIFDPQGSIATEVDGLNSHDAVVGNWEDDQTALHGFIRDARGKITNIDVPNAADTLPIAINDKGTIVGLYFAGPTEYAFMRSREGTISVIEPQGATFVEVHAINDKGEIAGYYWGQNGPSHGFIRDTGGNYKTFDPEGAYGTEVYGMNATGATAGFYENGIQHGFLRRP